MQYYSQAKTAEEFRIEIVGMLRHFAATEYTQISFRKNRVDSLLAEAKFKALNDAANAIEELTFK